MEIRKIKSVISIIVIAVILLITFSTVTYGAQVSSYDDPADHWLSSNNRTNELDVNSVITYETQSCAVCGKITSSMIYRVPEYTKSGETALNHGVRYSDGTCIDGVTKGNTDSGTPGVNATFTGYHYTKSVCQNCGTINSSISNTEYEFNKNVYRLNPCDSDFFVEFDNTTHKEYNDRQHTTILKKGEYCQFCKGTFAQAISNRENHSLKRQVDGQAGNNRFYLSEYCEDCGYKNNEYVTAKAVITSYYGNADGKAHTVTVTDLSDTDVHTSIRYGTSASDCNMTTAPVYINAGYYTVYYEIDYQYEDENITENGVSYVWLLDNQPQINNAVHTHDYRYLETIKPTCLELGYERWQCNICGGLIKQNYIPATGHNYKSTTLKEATCQTAGVVLEICKQCGDFRETHTELADHSYIETTVNPTCKTVGYVQHECEICGDSYITNITPIIAHKFKPIIKEASCTDGGYTTYICSMCNLSYIDDYTDALGHEWDDGRIVTNSSCESDGVIEFICQRCGEKMIKAENAKGHTAGEAASCTSPQLCEDCGAILELPTGHNYITELTEPSCTEMGYTTYTCSYCGDSYNGNYTNALEHKPSDWITDVAATIEHAGEKHIECLTCGNILARVDLPQLTETDRSDEDGNVKVGDYSILVTDSKSVPVFNSKITIDSNDNVTINLPEKRLLDYADQTIITVMYTGTQMPKKNMNIVIFDDNNNMASGKTDAAGQLKVPNDRSNTGDNNGTIGRDDNDKKQTLVVSVIDKDNKVIPNCNVYIGENNDIVVDLPDGIKPSKESPITVTVTDQNGKPQPSITVIALGEADFIEKGVTNSKGKIILPANNSGGGSSGGSHSSGGSTNSIAISATEKHFAYILGYPDGAFRPNNNMNRAEAAAIFARLVSQQKGESISGNSSFKDVVNNRWYSAYIGYLEKYGIINGYTDKTFKPDNAVSRSEFVAMTVRFYGLFDKVKYPANTTKYVDVNSKHWGIKDISFATAKKWLNGYPDGSFRPDNNITRAEVVTIVNHTMERTADEKYINQNFAALNKFNDLNNNYYWAFYDIIEAANSHNLTKKAGVETWEK